VQASPAIARLLQEQALEEAVALLERDELTDADALRIQALIDGLRDDMGPDPARFAPFDEEWLIPTAPRSWRWDWLWLRYVRAALTKMRQGHPEYRRIILIAPVRHGKSETTTARFPVYWLEQTPDQHVIIAMHTQKLANKFSRKARRIARLKLRLDRERSAVEEWETEEGGGLRAVGVGVAVAGVGANLAVIDDPIRSRKEAESQTIRDAVWEWYTDDLYTRLEPDGAILLTLARWHQDDLAGRILASEDAPNWKVIHLPGLALENDPLGRQPGEALEPGRYTVQDLERLRRVMGSYGFSGLIQGMPSPPEGGILKRKWWRFWAPPELVEGLPPVSVKLPDGSFFRIRAEPLPRVLPFEAQSWDMAFKDKEGNDYVAGGAWAKHGANMYLLDLIKAHLDFPATIDAVLDLTRGHPRARAKWVEDKANGPAVIQTLRSKVPGLIAVDPEGGKLARAHAAAPFLESGNVYLPHPALVGRVNEETGKSENWVLELIDNAAVLPNGLHDDDVDQLTQAVLKMQHVDATPREPGKSKWAGMKAAA
jgi:predicted phage terminase large subunit-like protein